MGEMKRRGFFGALAAVVGGALGWRGLRAEGELEGGGYPVPLPDVVWDGRWHYVSVEWSGGYITTHVDGKLWSKLCDDAARRGIKVTPRSTPQPATPPDSPPTPPAPTGEE